MRSLVFFALMLTGSSAFAQAPLPTAPPTGTSAPLPTWPQVGGHLGIAIPIATVANDGTTVIGRDFIKIGITPGLTVKLSEHWLVDFEFIAIPVWLFGHNGMPDQATTNWVVDPGVLYALPHQITVGLRVAVVIAEAQPFNYGLVPIVVKGFRISDRVSFFVEYDLPFFINAVPGKTTVAFTPCQLQTGFGF